MCGPIASTYNSMSANLSSTAAAGEPNQETKRNNNSSTSCGFQMPLHYPRYKKADYEKMPEWQLDCLLKAYGLPVTGDVEHKRKFAMGAFLWPDEY